MRAIGFRIHELINLHGHLMDEGEFDRLHELVTDDIVYDVSALGAGQLIGSDAIIAAGQALGDNNPLAHHVTNVIVVRIDNETAQVRSKGLAVMSSGVAASVVYDDELRRTDKGWRIAVRRVLPRAVPLRPSGPATRVQPRAT